MSLTRHPRGFTLVELMIVVAIVGVLAMIAIPKFGELIVRSKESSAKGALGQLRSALKIYYADTGYYPYDVSAIIPKYIQMVPGSQIPPVSDKNNPGHTSNDQIENYPDRVNFGSVNDGAPIWAYVNTGQDIGYLSFNCLHTTSRGAVWSDQ